MHDYSLENTKFPLLLLSVQNTEELQQTIRLNITSNKIGSRNDVKKILSPRQRPLVNCLLNKFEVHPNLMFGYTPGDFKFVVETCFDVKNLFSRHLLKITGVFTFN